MSRLFWKIFFSFWLVMILLVVTNLAVTWMQAKRFENSNQRTDQVAELAGQALSHYQQEGSAGLRKWRRELFRQTGMRVLLLNSQYQEVSGQPTPRHLIDLLKGHRPDFHDNRAEDDHHANRQGPPPLFDRPLDRPIVWPMSSSDGKSYNFVLLNPRELSDHLYASSTLLWRISISVLIVAVVALLLSLYLVKPIRLLQNASRKLANGDLNSRVSAAMGKRRDELGELGEDFDGMADKIQALLEGQQRMLRDVSHELRTPLARLRIALELSRKRSGESAELDRIELEAERINALIDDILQLVRLNNSQQPLRKEPLPLAELLQQLADDANLTSNRVEVDCPNELAINADRKLLSRAVDNIVQNALKYSEQAVEIVAKAEAEQVLIQIRDHGPGVEENQLANLFTAFFRTDQARGRDTGGYGLGLAIANQAIQAHHGQIQARNHPQGGLEVSIRLPNS